MIMDQCQVTLMGTLVDFDKDHTKKGKDRNGRKLTFQRQPVSKKVYCPLYSWSQELEKSNEIYDMIMDQFEIILMGTLMDFDKDQTKRGKIETEGICS